MWAKRKTVLYIAGLWAVFSTGGGLISPALAQSSCTPGIPCLSYTPDTDANKSKAAFSDLRKTCDGDVMNQIHARAFLESQRENMINQTAIRKPDSVLAYTCFDQYAGIAAQNAPKTFSESEDWSGKSISLSVTGQPAGSYPATRTMQVSMGSGHIDNLMNNMGYAPIQTFVNTNFPYDFLGDTLTEVSYKLGGSVQKTSSLNCGVMQAIWAVAKCENFQINPQLSQTFFSFKDLAEKDIRTLGKACNAPKISDQYIDAAENKAPDYKQFKSGEVTDPYKFVKVDGIRHLNEENKDDYFDPKLKPFDGGTSGDCAPPVKTGVKLLERQGSLSEYGDLQAQTPKEYEDAVCPNPECYYNAQSNGSQECTKK
ncbi:MAG: hypothetical protein LRY36_01585 [Alphaproteobacteria bacterium]|nr:hypothetical protein [Alphaproteobacteria bacterium]